MTMEVNQDCPIDRASNLRSSSKSMELSSALLNSFTFEALEWCFWRVGTSWTIGELSWLKTMKERRRTNAPPIVYFFHVD